MNAPLIFEVDRARDGGGFSVRRVVAIQHGRPIFNLAASFQKPETGLEHQADMPDVDGPDGLQDLTEVAAEILQEMPVKMRRFLTRTRPFEFRLVHPIDYTKPERRPPLKYVWIKAVDGLPDQAALHQNLLAYVSDYELLGTSTLPHGLTFNRSQVMMASLDHALWFHRDFRVDEWLLYSMDSPNSSGARGFSRGQFFNADGLLVASTAQEGLVRVLSEDDGTANRSEPKTQA